MVQKSGDHQLLKMKSFETWDILNINWLVGFLPEYQTESFGTGLVHTQLFSAIYRGPTTPFLGPPIYTHYC